MFFRVNLPNFLDPQTKSLRIALRTQLETFKQSFGERPATAFGKNRLLGFKLHAAGKTRRWSAVLTNTGIPGCNARHTALFIIQNFSRGKSGINLDAQTFSLRGKPF